MGNFNFNHPNYSFPKITNSTAIIKATELGHPLLKVAKRVDNNFSINSKEFFIVTGANMAGKSTFLRTVSLSIVMANIGLPVCAKMFEYCPAFYKCYDELLVNAFDHSKRQKKNMRMVIKQ